MKKLFVEKKFNNKSLNLIEIINEVITDYEAQGFDLTLRQVYYQLVARNKILNNEKSYKNIGNLINDARLAGLIDWNAIIDRTRNLANNSHWAGPQEILYGAAHGYAIDKRIAQPNYIEVWVEKDALKGIVGGVCRKADVPYFSCRGYTSQSEMYIAAERFKAENLRDRRVILHFGDHDPSGIDMTRDIKERLELFGADVEVMRIALTSEQIEQYAPPPNPAKITDSRAESYIKKFGYDSWELDALEPSVITGLIKENIDSLTDARLFEAAVKKQRQQQEYLFSIKDNYDAVVKFLKEKGL